MSGFVSKPMQVRLGEWNYACVSLLYEGVIC